jgi:hypothetical protein
MLDKVNKDNSIDMSSRLRNFVLNNFVESRIECLILYGSSLNEGNNLVKDFDFILLLDSYKVTDFDILEKFKCEIPNELFIDYKDQIIRKGINNYQRGRHGLYFFIALAYGKCLIGKNYYLDHLNEIDNKKVKKDLLFRVEEYFYRIQKHYLNDKSLDIEYIKKYISRIIFDILLYKQIINFKDFHKVHYLDILTKYIHNGIFPIDLAEQIVELVNNNNIRTVPKIVGGLYNVYINEFEANK